MRLTDFITRITGSLFCALILFSCDNGPDYGKMRVSRMDIVGAKAVGFITADNNSRGEAISSGLYKIDASGNITAVAVYFTEDESGNQSKHESEVKLESAQMVDVGNDFIYFTACWFVDKKGELIEDLPDKILVRKSDGKMWNLDYEVCGLNILDTEGWQFFQSYDGTLYYASFNNRTVENIYKFDLKTEPATIQQVTANIKLYPPYAVDSKGVICAPVNKFGFAYRPNSTIAWPNSGFQELELESVSTARTDYSDQVEGLVIEPVKCNSSVVCFLGQFYQLGAYSYNSNISEYPFVDLATCNKILIGDTPGSASVDVSETINLKNDILANSGFYDPEYHSSIMVTPDYILLSTRLPKDYHGGYKCWISALNPEKKEWKWITETTVFISFDDSIFYNNRYWSITKQDGALGAFWFHPGSFESGFIKFNVTLPDYIDSSKYKAVDGKVIYSGINPADSHLVKVVVDLMTGDAINNDEAPEMLFSTLISLN